MASRESDSATALTKAQEENPVLLVFAKTLFLLHLQNETREEQMQSVKNHKNAVKVKYTI